MTGVQLVRHWGVKDQAGSEAVTGHPVLPGSEVLAFLRDRVGGRNAPHDWKTAWWHRSGDAWATVQDLHQDGRHDEALVLARLLHWCDHYGPYDLDTARARCVRLWELRADTADPTNTLTDESDEFWTGCTEDCQDDCSVDHKGEQ